MRWGAVSIVSLLMFAAVLIWPVDGAGFGQDTELKDVQTVFNGENPDDLAGEKVAGAGDVNGDGLDDILITATFNDDGGSTAGKVYLVLGKKEGFGSEVDLSAADASFIGENTQDNAGMAIAGAGDVNGDGFDDILIGAPYNDKGGINRGQVYVIFGKDRGWARDVDLANADASFLGEADLDQAGVSLAGAGDVNGDGFDDILIGSPQNSENGLRAGQAYLILGKPTGWAKGVALSNADASFLGENSDDKCGLALSGVGDVNGDGYDDVLISSVGFKRDIYTVGRTYLIFGRGTGWSRDTSLSSTDAAFEGGIQGSGSGFSLAGKADVNGDGLDDILIGNHLNNEAGSQTGKTFLFLGRKSGWSTAMKLDDADASFLGENDEDLAGYSISLVDDVNEDGFDDVLIGAVWNDESALQAGQTYLILGRDIGWKNDMDLANADASFLGLQEWVSGASVAGLGDVNGDGMGDFMIGAPGMQGNIGGAFLVFYTPPAPGDVRGKLDGDGRGISFTWNEVHQFWQESTHFEIYRSVDGLEYQMVGRTNELGFKDTNLELYRTYYYRIGTAYGPEIFNYVTLVIFNDLDNDLDNIGDAYDPDDDNDGVADVSDAFPFDEGEWVDTDGDGVGDNSDEDDDGDGLNDTVDERPLDPLNAIMDDIDGLKLRISDLEEKVENLTATIEASIMELISNLSYLQGNLSNEVSLLYDALDSLREENIEFLTVAMETLEEILSNSGVTNSSLLSQIESIGNDVDALKDTLETVDSLEERVDDLEEEGGKEEKGSIIYPVLFVILFILVIVQFLLLLRKKRPEGREDEFPAE